MKQNIIFPQKVVKEIQFSQISLEEIKLILNWYKSEFFQVREAYYYNNILKAKIKFSEYPFVNGKMPFISSNLINLAMDQCVLIHIGTMIKNKFIKVLISDKNGNLKPMTFDEYNHIVGDEFVTAKINAKYHRPIPPIEEIQMISNFLNLRRSGNGRYILDFSIQSEPFLFIQAIFVYPLTLRLVKGG